MCLKKKAAASKNHDNGLFVCKKCGQTSDNPIEMCKAKPSKSFAKGLAKREKG